MNRNITEKSVYEEVKAHLINTVRDIKQPVRVREVDLARRLGVSRTPIREALIRLEGTGLIALHPGKGALLSPVTDVEYVEWLELREMLEGFAAYHAALNASKHDVDELYSLFDSYIGRDEFTDEELQEYAKVNVAFHQKVIQIANNNLLLQTWLAFGHRGITYKRQTIKKLHRIEQSLKEHLLMIGAIERRDAEQAREIAQKHVSALKVSFKNAVLAAKK